MSDPLLLAYYGDDFTGSTDVMEALAGNGVPTVLFTRLPDDAVRARFPGVRAVGLAGTSRSQPPAWMDVALPAIFGWLRDQGAAVAHYKTCSTFDSAPHLGSIGRATEIGLAAFGQAATAIVVGAPQLRRYTAFGTLFAGYAGRTWRIDRHPVMSRHPATPMDEADLLLHLARQTDFPTALVDQPALAAGAGEIALDEALAAGARAVLVDVCDLDSQRRAGELIWRCRRRIGPLLVGSSGVEYALLPVWRAEGLATGPVETAALPPRARIAVVSGSCSAVTEGQIRSATAAGFDGIAVDYRVLASGDGAEAALELAAIEAGAVLAAGRSPIVYTALGPDSIAGLPDAGGAVGRGLGRLLARLADEHGLDRIAVAGGDTSSHALAELDVCALTLRRPIADSPGSPVCTAHRTDPAAGTLDLILKGGQVGKPDYFARLRDGF